MVPHSVVAAAYPVTTAGPKALAGLMQFELTGPVIHMLKVMPRAIAKGPNLPQPLQAHTHIQPWADDDQHKLGYQLPFAL